MKTSVPHVPLSSFPRENLIVSPTPSVSPKTQRFFLASFILCKCSEIPINCLQPSLLFFLVFSVCPHSLLYDIFPSLLSSTMFLSQIHSFAHAVTSTWNGLSCLLWLVSKVLLNGPAFHKAQTVSLTQLKLIDLYASFPGLHSC